MTTFFCTTPEMAPRFRTRLWCFTNYDMNFNYTALVPEPMQYIAWGDESCPTTSRPHHQGFVFLAKKTDSIAKVAHMLGGCHVEPCRGSLDQNETYCSKMGSYHELGARPTQGQRNDLSAIAESVRSGATTYSALLETDPHAIHTYGRVLAQIQAQVDRGMRRTWMTEGWWLWGPTGTGKSERAFADYDPDTHYVLNLEDNGWWEGYEGQETVIFADFRGGNMKYATLLRLCDKYPVTVPRRGMSPAPFLAKKIIVTSSLPPEECYSGLASQDSLDQLHRRFKVEHSING